MLCKSWDISVDVDGIFLFPQANGHVSQDQEPIYPESTARAPAEDETQVGPLLSLCLCLCSFTGVLRLLLGASQRTLSGERRISL